MDGGGREGEREEEGNSQQWGVGGGGVSHLRLPRCRWKQGQYSNRWGACLWAAGRKILLPTNFNDLRWKWNGGFHPLSRRGLVVSAGVRIDESLLLDSSWMVPRPLCGVIGSSQLSVSLSLRSRKSGVALRFLERGHPVMLGRFRRRHCLRRESHVPVVLVLLISDAVS